MRRFVLALVALIGIAIAFLFVAEKFAASSPATEQPEEEIEDSVRPGLTLAEEMDLRWEEIEREETRLRQEAEERAKARVAALKKRKNTHKRRTVRRFTWKAAANATGTEWNIPEEDSHAALLTAFTRVCIAEADGNPQDCVGIWQSLSNIRRRECERGAVRRITECDENGETMLSVFRRGQPHILNVKGYALRNARAGWIRNLETDCEMPEGYLSYLRRVSDDITEDKALNMWDAQYGSRRCPYVVQLGNALISGEPLISVSRPGHRLKWIPGRPITWGGRCESNKASCDDRVACARGLSRINTGPKTYNAFWRRPRTTEEVDPICKALGYGHLIAER